MAPAWRSTQLLLAAGLLVLASQAQQSPPGIVSRPQRRPRPSRSHGNSTAADEESDPARRELTDIYVKLDKTKHPPPSILIGDRKMVYMSPISITLYGAPGRIIHFTDDGSEPTRNSRSVQSGGVVGVGLDTILDMWEMHSTKTVIVRAFTRSNNEEWQDSEESSMAVDILRGRHGVAYLAPYLNQDGHFGKAISVDMITSPRNKVRIHGVHTDFADYFSPFFVQGREYRGGIGPYDGQVTVDDFPSLGFPAAKGFMGAFMATSIRRNGTITDNVNFTFLGRHMFPGTCNDTELLRHAPCERNRNDDVERLQRKLTQVVETNYGIYVPFFNGEYSGTVVRTILSQTERRYIESLFWGSTTDCCIPEAIDDDNRTAVKEYCCTNSTFNTSSTYQEFDTFDIFRRANHSNASSEMAGLISSVNLTEVDPDLRGFSGGFNVRDHAYFVPFFDGHKYGSKFTRVNINNFNTSTVEVMDLRLVDKELAGFFGGFSYLSAADIYYAFLVPHRNMRGPVDQVNSEYTVDGFTGEWVNKHRRAVGGDHLETHYHGKLVRVNLNNFTHCSTESVAVNCSEVLEPIVDVLDLTKFDPDLRGFAGGFVAGQFGYLVPYKNREGPHGFFGKVVRINLENFLLSGKTGAAKFRTVKVLDLTMLNPDYVGFVGGMSWYNYGLLVPHRNDKKTNYNMRLHHGKMIRFSLTDFDLSGLEPMDLSAVSRKQVPAIPDPDLRGYFGGFVAGNYALFVPHYSNQFSGKLTRVDMRDYEELVGLQNAGLSTDIVTFPGDTYDGLQLDGVQEINLQLQDYDLSGFSGGFVAPSEESLKFSSEYSFTAYNSQRDLINWVTRLPGAHDNEVRSRGFHVMSRGMGVICQRYEDRCLHLTNQPEDLQSVNVMIPGLVLKLKLLAAKERFGPTPAPTMTAMPTEGTDAPTSRPTNVPTIAPTVFPTVSQAPTPLPTT